MAGELTYTPRERTFVAWSAILGYAFDFYNLIVVAFLMIPIQKTLNVSQSQTGLIVAGTLAASVLGGILFGWLGDKIGRKWVLMVTIALMGGASTLIGVLPGVGPIAFSDVQSLGITARIAGTGARPGHSGSAPRLAAPRMRAPCRPRRRARASETSRQKAAPSAATAVLAALTLPASAGARAARREAAAATARLVRTPIRCAR